MNNINILKSSIIETKIGNMIAVANENFLYLLEFIDTKNLDKKLNTIKKELNCEINPGNSGPINLISKEIKEYFAGTLKEFKTPLFLVGTEFEKKVWQELIKIPHGTVISYSQLAIKIGNPKAFRAAANANGKNKLPIIIPCHRVIASNKTLGGYSAGLERKKYLLNHEKNI